MKGRGLTLKAFQIFLEDAERGLESTSVPAGTMDRDPSGGTIACIGAGTISAPVPIVTGAIGWIAVAITVRGIAISVRIGWIAISVAVAVGRVPVTISWGR